MKWINEIPDKRVRDAYAIVGNQDETILRNMVRALELPISRFLNTPEDIERLKAAKTILAYRNRTKRQR